MRVLFACVTACAALVAVSCASASSQEDGDGTGEGGETSAGGSTAQVGSGGASGRGGAPSAPGTGSSGRSSAGSGPSGSTGSGGSGTSGGTGGSGATNGAPVDSGGSANEDGDAGAAGSAASAGLGSNPAFGVYQGECVAPCELELAPSENLPGESAVVLYDALTNTALVTSDPAANAARNWVIGFTYETDPELGYASWSTNGWSFAFTEPLEYVSGTQSMRQDVEITSQMVNSSTNQIVRVVYSFGQESVRIHEIGVPDCDGATGGACASVKDCKAVEAGGVRGAAEICGGTCGNRDCVADCVAKAESLSVECSGCYADFVACVSMGCASDCPGTGGKACMTCETEHQCHTAFMACSGLNHMPRGTLTWPAAQVR